MDSYTRSSQSTHQSRTSTILSKLRDIFLPISRAELPRFIPMSSLMFCIIFNQNILRILKDGILIAEVSAEITSFSKVYVVTPLAAIFVIMYTKLVDCLMIHQIFYCLMAFFMSFYFAFAFIIYPNIETFHMDNMVLNSLMQQSPHLKWYIAIIANWSYVIFYSLSELWPNIFYTLMFWQIANEITKTSEAKRFYTLFSLFGNSSLILVGYIMMNLSAEQGILRHWMAGTDGKIALTQVAIGMVCISSVCACLLVRYISKTLIKRSEQEQRKLLLNKLTRPKMGVIASFKYIARSKYLWLMLICSASFGLSMNLVESVWKAKIKELYPTVSMYAEINSLYIFWTGIAIVAMTVIGSNIMRKGNWFVAAVITPVIILITGVIFFALIVWDEYIVNTLDMIILVSPLALAVFLGAVQNILSKGAKYSILDTSNQMLYIPLDQELRTKGKAAVDVVSPKIGKSTSGLLMSLIFTLWPTASYSSIALYLMVIFISVCVIWIYATRTVYFEYQKIV